MFPKVRTILDIGGQDSKVIAVNDEGKVIKFEMNDRCAAGTGKFLEIMAKSLGFSLDQFGMEALQATKDIRISSMCTVFAESEITSLVAKGENPQMVGALGAAHISWEANSISDRAGDSTPKIGNLFLREPLQY